MSVNKYDASTGQLVTLASGSRTWIGTKAAYEAAKQAGTLPNDCLIAITDDENDRAVSGTNLLDNPWFTVNQRGQSSYGTPYSYTVDRWKMANLSSVVKNADDSITISRASETGNTYLFQSYPREVGEKLNGKDVTLSVLLSNDRIFEATGKYVVGGGYNFIDKTDNESKVRLQVSSPSNTDYDFVDLGINGANTSITIKAAKLEIGTASTLENDTAPNYATELLKCQRYFQRMEGLANVGLAFVNSTTSLRWLLSLPCNMRSLPTIKTGGIGLYNSTGSIAASAVSAQTLSNNVIAVALDYTTGGLTLNSIYLVQVTTGSYIEFSADL